MVGLYKGACRRRRGRVATTGVHCARDRRSVSQARAFTAERQRGSALRPHGVSHAEAHLRDARPGWTVRESAARPRSAGGAGRVAAAGVRLAEVPDVARFARFRVRGDVAALEEAFDPILAGTDATEAIVRVASVGANCIVGAPPCEAFRGGALGSPGEGRSALPHLGVELVAVEERADRVAPRDVAARRSKKL